MIDRISRARVIGALILVIAFAAGVLVGRYLPREPREGVTIIVRGSARIPEELEELGLTDSQRTIIRGFLHDGTLRIGSIVREFSVPIHAAIDSTDRQIRSVLSESQNRRLDDFRRVRPLRRMQEKRVIDTVRP
jgi:hypothetical protein